MNSSNEIKSKKNVYIAAAVFYVLLIGVWSLSELFVMPRIISAVPETAADLIKEIGFKLPVWLIPALLLWKRFDGDMYVHFKEMLSLRKEHLWYLGVIAIFTAFHLVTAFRLKGGISLNSSFTPWDILSAAVIGLCEEAVFRGFLLNPALRSDKTDALPIAVNAVLFLLIHFPVWFRTGALAQNFTSGAFVQLIILSVVFSVSFKNSKSLLIPAALHMYWDLLCFML